MGALCSQHVGACGWLLDSKATISPSWSLTPPHHTVLLAPYCISIGNESTNHVNRQQASNPIVLVCACPLLLLAAGCVPAEPPHDAAGAASDQVRQYACSGRTQQWHPAAGQYACSGIQQQVQGRCCQPIGQPRYQQEHGRMQRSAMQCINSSQPSVEHEKQQPLQASMLAAGRCSAEQHPAAAGLIVSMSRCSPVTCLCFTNHLTLGLIFLLLLSAVAPPPQHPMQAVWSVGGCCQVAAGPPVCAAVPASHWSGTCAAAATCR
jgi:hypothetical protein